jgi:glucokinase
MADKNFILAIDIGGTKIAAALVDESGNIHRRQEVPTLAQEGREGILRRVEQSGRHVLAGFPAEAISAAGVASAGQIDPSGRKVYYATEYLPGWSGLDLCGIIEAMFGLPTVADNDANAMAAAEMNYGTGRGYRDVICVMVGTGIGGAIIQNGVLNHGAHGGAGEFGHLPVQALGGRPCNCGGTGCVEVYASSQALVHNLIEAAGEAEVEHHLHKVVDLLTIQDIASAFHNPAKDHWLAFHHIINEAADALGAGLAAAANLLDPQLIIIAGSILLLGDPYLEMVRQSYLRRAMEPRRAARLCFSTLGQDPALIGAALLARQRFA